MTDKLTLLLAKIKELENELLAEIHEGREKFGYEVLENKVHFEDAVRLQHRKVKKSLFRFFRDSKSPTVLIAPVIWSCVVPVLFLDLMAEIYQFICFPVYGIPKVPRCEYIILDRRHLTYLMGWND